MHYDEDEKIRKVVKEAVAETLTGIGIDASDIRETQADFMYIRKMRLGSEYMRQRLKTTCISVCVPAFLYVMWESFKQMFSDSK